MIALKASLLRSVTLVCLLIVLLNNVVSPSQPVQANPVSRVIIYGQGCYSCFIHYSGSLERTLHQIGILNIEVINVDERPEAAEDLAFLFSSLAVPESLRGDVVVEYVPESIIVDFIERLESRYSRIVVMWDERVGNYKVVDASGDIIECWIENSVEECLEGSGSTPNPLIALILVSGLMDGINPCAFAVLLFFLSLLFVTGTNQPFDHLRRKLLLIGSTYIVAVYTAYLFIGLVFIRLFESLPFPHLIATIGSIIMIIMGVINIKEYIWPGRWISFRRVFSLSTSTLVSKYSSWMTQFVYPATFALGFLVGLFEFPCTGGVYMGILGVLAEQTRFIEGIGYLILYNLAFVLPLVVILLLITQKQVYRTSIERWRRRHQRLLRLESGLFMIILGIVLLLLTS
jgi:cytochrome c biogenesis protein CcdA